MNWLKDTHLTTRPTHDITATILFKNKLACPYGVEIVKRR